jgi:hypothetical protein
MFCESGRRSELSNKPLEHGSAEDVNQNQGLDMSVERKLKEEEVFGEEKQNGTNHESPHESDNEGSNHESAPCIADDDATRKWRADVRLVIIPIKIIDQLC